MMMDRFQQEFKFGLRSLVRAPIFSLAVVFTLALGCAATTAIFSVVNATLLKSLPYEHPERIVDISSNNISHNIQRISISPGEYTDLKASTNAFSDLSFSTDATYTVTGLGDPKTVMAYRLSANFLPLLGVTPAAGRNFLAEEAESSAKVVLLSDGFWQLHFSGNKNDVVGHPIALDGEAYTIVGVMPAGFEHPSAGTDLWTPLRMPADAPTIRAVRYLHVLGRLAPGVTLKSARAQLAGLAERLQKNYPNTNTGWSLDAVSIRDAYVGDLRTPLLILQAGSIFLLLIASANLANLLLARAIAQQKQFAVRMALGAGGWAVFARLAADALILSFFGAAAGVALARGILVVLHTLTPTAVINQAFPALQGIPLNGWIMALSVLGCMVVGVLVGAVPVWRSLTPKFILEALGEGTRSASKSIVRNHTRSALVITEVALSVLLLIGSGLMIKTMVQLRDKSLGFNTNNVLTVRVILPVNRYSTPAITSNFVDQEIQRMTAIPGVKVVGATSILPLSGMATKRPLRLEMDPFDVRYQHMADYRVISADYFKAMEIRLIAGRFFDQRDRLDSPPTIVINQSLARLFHNGVSPIGQRIISADLGKPEAKEVVGIVEDIREAGFSADPQPTIYRPFTQAWAPLATFVLRTPTDPMSISHAASDAIWQMDKELPVNAIAPMDQLVSESLALRRLILMILSVFAVTGLLLATVGLYGLIAYDVSQRTQEIGIRAALGAQKSHILWIIMRRAFMLVLIGECLGLFGAVISSKTLTVLLYGVRPTDFITFLTACLLITAVTAFASLVPSWRALRVDPATILQRE